MREAENWKHVTGLLGACAMMWMFLAVDARAQSPRPRRQCGTAADIDLQQNWNNQEKVKFWFRSQGSRIMPYSWFIALEQATGEDLLIDSCYMESLGFIAVPGHRLPIGFAEDTNRTGTATYVGLTCAACHTARLTIGTRTAIVEGGPALVDFSAFLNTLVASTAANHEDDAKFKRWADRVNDTSVSRPELRRRLKALKEELADRSAQNTPEHPYGFGRVDAFGHIFNRVFANAVHDLGNIRRPDAPVSYPFLWDTPKDMHKKVQWNWSAENGSLFIGVPGDLIRNLGELLGVFGTFDLTRFSTCFLSLPCYKTSSFNRSKLDRLEKQVETLWSPVWPSDLPGMSINQTLKAKGKEIYEGKGKCSSCHSLIERDDPDRESGDDLVPLETVMTDSAMTDAYNRRLFDDPILSGLLKGRRISPIGTRKFGEITNGSDVLLHVVSGVFFGGGRHDGSVAREARAEVAPPKGYKARSLNGIWATAPYLHNGSVPNLRTLLRKRDRTEGFWVGNNTFDPKNVGLSIEKGPNASWFDPTKPGDSNQGHPFGVDTLDEDEKNALLEFLKTL